MPVHSNVQFDWGSAVVYFDPQSTKDPKHTILSSGIFQFGEKFTESPKSDIMIPHHIIIDIKPSVFPADMTYPFTNNREAFRKSVEKDIQKLKTYLCGIHTDMQNKQLQKILEHAICMPRLHPGQKVEDVGGWRPFFRESSGDASSAQETQPPVPTGQPTLLRPSLSRFAQCPTTHPILLSNVVTDNFFAPGNPAQQETKQFFAELGSIVMDLKDAMAKSSLPGYEHFQPNTYYAGVLLDKKIHGLHVPEFPIKSILVNPLNWTATTTDGLRRSILNTIIHEIAHFKESGHGVGHNQAMAQVQIYLADQGALENADQRLNALLEDHKKLLVKMRKTYEKAHPLDTSITGIE